LVSLSLITDPAFPRKPAYGLVDERAPVGQVLGELEEVRLMNSPQHSDDPPRALRNLLFHVPMIAPANQRSIVA
jgi:hypothetical protein